VQTADLVPIGDRRELFVDDLLLDELRNARLSLHASQRQEIVYHFDKPWEGL